MNHRNDDDRRDYQSAHRYGPQSGGQRESARQGGTRQDYDEQSDRARTSQAQASRNRGEYYGGEQFDERSQRAGWNEDHGSWDYEGGPERYGASGYSETAQGNPQGQYGRQQGNRSQVSGQREYGSQNTGASDYYRGRQGYSAQGSYGSDYNTHGRNQGYGDAPGSSRAQQLRGQHGRQFAERPAYGSNSLHGGESAGTGGRGSLYGESLDYLDDGEMSGYGGRESRRPYATSIRQSSRTSFRGVGPKSYRRSDERLAEDINERLTDDDDLDASEIVVRVSDGKVALEGKVDQRWMKHRAEDIADACTGVKEVDNRIQVTSMSSVLGQRTDDTRETGSSRAAGTQTTANPTGGTTPH